MKCLKISLIAFLWAGVHATRHEVKVGQNGLTFEPETVNAVPGDTVTYSFYAKNHTVTQSSFNKPCEYQEGGFFSGFVPTPDGGNPSLTTYTLQVTDTKPIWLFCSQGQHCKGGMVHAINAPTQGNTIGAYKEKAKSAGPGGVPSNGLPFGGTRKLAVQVGKDGLSFTPSDIIEPPGTVVEFSFFPKQHTVTQSSFDKPCVPLDGGFSSGFIPTEQSPSGVTFEVTVKDTKPVWFYCAQTKGEHCQSGMVGSINAAQAGDRTLDAFKKLAANAGESKIQDKAPLGGNLFVNGTAVPQLQGNVLNVTAWEDMDLDDIPETGKMDPYMKYQAGGDAIENYGWGKTIDEETVKLIQLLQWLDNILLAAFMRGLGKLTRDWSGSYPEVIMHTLRSMTAQAYVHRMTSTDTLKHYKKDTMKACEYNFEMSSPKQFLDTVVTILLLEIALLTDIVATVAQKDAWLVPSLATSIGSKGRMSGVLNMMQGHMAAATPREASLTPGLVYSYAHTKWVKSCPSGIKAWDDLPGLKVVDKKKKNGKNGRVDSIKLESEQGKDAKWAAFVGPWGKKHWVKMSNGEAKVPDGLYGHVWVVMTDEDDSTSQNLYNVTAAGPEMLWISQP